MLINQLEALLRGDNNVFANDQVIHVMHVANSWEDGRFIYKQHQKTDAVSQPKQISL